MRASAAFLLTFALFATFLLLAAKTGLAGPDSSALDLKLSPIEIRHRAVKPWSDQPAQPLSMGRTLREPERL